MCSVGGDNESCVDVARGCAQANLIGELFDAEHFAVLLKCCAGYDRSFAEHRIEVGAHRHGDEWFGPRCCEMQAAIYEIDFGGEHSALHYVAEVVGEKLSRPVENAAAARLVARQRRLVDQCDRSATFRQGECR